MTDELENFKTWITCKYCRYWLQNFTVTLLQLYAKHDFNASLQWCRGFSHWKITSANWPLHFARIWLGEIEMRSLAIEINSAKTLYQSLASPSCPSHRYKPVLHPAVQCWQIVAITPKWVPKAIPEYYLMFFFRQCSGTALEGRMVEHKHRMFELVAGAAGSFGLLEEKVILLYWYWLSAGVKNVLMISL